jgi:hypothetical protein
MAGILQNNSLRLNNATMGSPSGSTPLYPLRAACKGRGTTRNMSLNVASVSRLGTGRYRLNLSTATSSNSTGSCSGNYNRSVTCNCAYNTTSRFYFSFRGTNDRNYDENTSWGVLVTR